MKAGDEGIVFDCGDATLVGVVSVPEDPGEVGMVIIVGGPQYRAGSHRQFVSLARRAAQYGVSTLRFDYRGMGDSSGAPVGFEGADRDVEAAIDALMRRCPSVRKVFLWGLCDGASAALLYLQRTRDRRVAGVCILNPWVRTAATLARTQVKHYYGQRLMQREFWTKLLGGRLNVGAAVRELLGKVRASKGMGRETAASSFQDRMALALKAFPGQVLLVLSGQDLTAKEFLEYTTSAKAWSGVLDSGRLERCVIADADHTFSTGAWKAEVEAATIRWITGRTPLPPTRPHNSD